MILFEVKKSNKLAVVVAFGGMAASAAKTAATKLSSAVTRPGRSTFDRLLCPSIPALHQAIVPQSRIMAVDVTSTHVSLAVSDPAREKAIPFGILSRTKSPLVDAKLFSSAFANVEKLDNTNIFISALIVSISPIERSAMQAISYARDLIDTRPNATNAADANAEGQENNTDTLFPDLRACMLYSEAHALLKAVRGHRDYIDAVAKLPVNLESRRRSRFENAMNPKMAVEDLVNNQSVKARISASEVLQAALDDLASLDRALNPGEPPAIPEEVNYRPWMPSDN